MGSARHLYVVSLHLWCDVSTNKNKSFALDLANVFFLPGSEMDNNCNLYQK
jgi:hypothetical protein